MKRKAAPITWYGGKFYLLSTLLPLLPPHTTYVEVFGGAAHLLFAKPPSPIEVYNDIDDHLVTFFRTLQRTDLFPTFLRQALLTLYSHEEYQTALYYFQQGQQEHNALMKAVMFWVIVNGSMSGRYMASWSVAVSHSRRGMPSKISRYFTSLECLQGAHRRLQKIIILQQDFRKVLHDWDSPDTFFYCDPPYVPETRKSPQQYVHEMSLQDHKDLVSVLLTLKGKVLLSGYAHPVYEPLEQTGWLRIDIPVYERVSNPRKTKKRSERLESLWVSPNLKRGLR